MSLPPLRRAGAVDCTEQQAHRNGEHQKRRGEKQGEDAEEKPQQRTHPSLLAEQGSAQGDVHQGDADTVEKRGPPVKLLYIADPREPVPQGREAEGSPRQEKQIHFDEGQRIVRIVQPRNKEDSRPEQVHQNKVEKGSGPEVREQPAEQGEKVGSFHKSCVFTSRKAASITGARDSQSEIVIAAERKAASNWDGGQ